MIKNLLPLLLTFSLFFSGLLAACSTTPKLDGTDWQLIEMNRKAIPLPIQITLGFKDGQAGGKAACNGYGAGFTQDGDKLTFEQFFSTLMYCEGVMDYETEFLNTFSLVKSFKLENEQLKLLDESGAVLLAFGQPQPYPVLEGSSWKATVVGETVVPEDVEVTLSFADGKITGKAACNTYFAEVSQEGGALNLSAIGATEMYCDKAGVMDLESAFRSNLEKVRKFELQMGNLALMDETGVALIYLRP